MNKTWVLGLALLAAPAWGLADNMQGMDMGGMTTPAATAQVTPVAAHKKTKKPKKRHKKVSTEKMPMSKTNAKTADDKDRAGAAKAKKQRWVCPMDGYVSDHPGKCPRCGMDLVLEKDGDTPAAKP